MSVDSVLSEGEKLRALPHGGWHFEQWSHVHGEALLRVARAASTLIEDADKLGVLHLCRDGSQQCRAVMILRNEGRRVGSVGTSASGLRDGLAALGDAHA